MLKKRDILAAEVPDYQVHQEAVGGAILLQTKEVHYKDGEVSVEEDRIVVDRVAGDDNNRAAVDIALDLRAAVRPDNLADEVDKVVAVVAGNYCMPDVAVS